jgi:hypothetical protein
MFSLIIMYNEELKGITYETRFYLSENAYHWKNNISCQFGVALSISGEPHQKPLRAALWWPLLYCVKIDILY